MSEPNSRTGLLLPHQIQCAGTSSMGHQGCTISHAFTTALHSPRLHTIILSNSTNIPPSFNDLFTLSIHSDHGLPLNLTSLTSDPTILFNNWFPFILPICPNHLHTLYSTRPTNASSPLHLLISHSIHARYFTHGPQTPHFHYI